MTILTFGKHKGEMLEATPESYIKWLATHKKVLSVENRHFSDLAKFLLERIAQVATVAEFEARKEAEMAVKVAEQLVRASQVKHSNFTSPAFSLLR